MKIFSTLILLFTICISTLNAQISIREARAADADGALTMLGAEVTVTGIAIGPNFRPGGQTFALVDPTDNIGITVFSISDDFGYAVTDGDELEVTGELAQFNGLAEIIPTIINVLSQGNTVPDPSEITVLDENTESNLVVFKDATLVDENDWSLSGSFNVDVTNGTETIQLRIDSDTDISGMEAPIGTFDVTGIGGQFDGDSPFDDGYQLFPRAITDINPYNSGEVVFTPLTMSEARETEADGSLSRDDERVELTGTVHGINLRPSGLQFFLIDNTNTGIAVFSGSDQLGYTVNEGDNITIRGVLSQFNALAQISPEEIDLNSVGNSVNTPDEVDAFSEDTESAWISINAIDYVDIDQWLGDGSSFNVDVVNVTGDTLRIRIDNDTPLSMAVRPGFPAFVTGVGSQFDSSSPFDSGYQILPMHDDAFSTYLGVDNLYDGNISISPIPSDSYINIEADNKIKSIDLYNLQGKKIRTFEYDSKIQTTDILDGIYFIVVNFEEKVWTQKIVIQH